MRRNLTPAASREPLALGSDKASLAPSRRAGLDFLRFFAAALVVLYHYQSEGPWALSRLSPIFLRGYLATDFFLILSGYVLGRAYGAQVESAAISDRRFLMRRVLRIWPAHLVMLIAFATTLLAAGLLGRMPVHPEAFRWSELPAQALLIQAWSGHGGGWNTPTWTLSALVACYAAFPTIWRGLVRFSRRSSGLTLFLSGLLAIWLTDLVCRRLWGHTVYDLHFNLGVIRAMPLFIFGMCIALGSERVWLHANLATGIAVASGVAIITLQELGRFDLLSVAFCGLLITSCGQTQVSRGAALAFQGARLSFALYITHIFIGMLWFNLTRGLVAHFHLGERAYWGLWTAAFPVALLAALLFNHLIDEPLQQRMRLFLSQPRGARLTPRPAAPGPA